MVVAKFNVESDSKDLKVELLLQGVMPQSLPALILFHKNKVLTTWKGVIRREELNAMLEEHVNDTNEGSSASKSSSSATDEAPRRKSGLISFAGSDQDDYMLKMT